MGTVAGDAVRWVAVLSAFANLGIHLALVPEHLAEKTYIGVLFVIGSALLGAVMVGLSTDRDHLRTLAWLAGTAICGVMFILFVVSRTSGLPGGYKEGWAGSYENVLGLVSLGLEVVFVAAAVPSLVSGRLAAGPRWVPLHDRTAPLA